jgi:hypothetical protein
VNCQQCKYLHACQGNWETHSTCTSKHPTRALCSTCEVAKALALLQDVFTIIFSFITLDNYLVQLPSEETPGVSCLTRRLIHCYCVRLTGFALPSFSHYSTTSRQPHLYFLGVRLLSLTKLFHRCQAHPPSSHPPPSRS